MLLAIVALVGIVRLPSFVHQLFDPDEAAIAAQAIAVQDGGTLYVDVADRKPPLPPLVYAAVFQITGSRDLRPLHGLVALGIAAATVLLALDARRRSGAGAAWWAAVLFACGTAAFFPVDGAAANYAHFAVAPGAAAVVWARRGTTARSVAAGLALGVAVLCRQSWIVGVVPAAFAAATHGRPRDAAVLIGATTATIASAGLVAPLGDFIRWTFTGTTAYVLAPADPGVTLLRLLGTLVVFGAFHPTLVALLGWAARRRIADPGGCRGDLDLWLWLASALVAVVAGLRFFGHYWYQVLPPAVALAAPLAACLSGRARALAIGGVIAPTACAVALAFAPGALRSRLDPAKLARLVEARSGEGDPVLVWGSYPDVLWKAGRPPGGALVHSDFVTGRSGGRDDPKEPLADGDRDAYEQMMRELREDPPALVLDTSTREDLGYSAYPLSRLPDLYEFVHRGYEPIEVVDDVTVYAPRLRR